MRRLVLVASVVLLSAASFGCGGDSGPKLDPVPGTYVLRSVQGNNVPYKYFENVAGNVAYYGGSIVFSADKTFVEHLTTRVQYYLSGDPDGYTSYQYTGTYTRTGQSVRLVYTSDGTTVDATLQNGVMTLQYAAGNWVYEKP